MSKTYTEKEHLEIVVDLTEKLLANIKSHNKLAEEHGKALDTVAELLTLKVTILNMIKKLIDRGRTEEAEIWKEILNGEVK